MWVGTALLSAALATGASAHGSGQHYNESGCPMAGNGPGMMSLGEAWDPG